MKENYLLQHKTALLNPYGSIVQVLDGDPDKRTPDMGDN